MPTSSRFMTAPQLHALLGSDATVRVLDVRHMVGADRMRHVYEAGHIPGAVYVEMRDELAGPASAGRGGRNPLPQADALQSHLRRWGVGAESTVVVYAGVGQPAAGRAWWVLTWAGVPVRILAGGYEAWVTAGFPVTTGTVTPETPTPPPSTRTVRPGQLPDVTVAEVPAYAQRGQLVDVRPRTDFEQGHIPGAVNLPYTGLTGTDDLPLAARDIQALLAAQGVDHDAPVALTCGGGVAAAWSAAILEDAGIRTVLHAGSWSEWCTRPGLSA